MGWLKFMFRGNGTIDIEWITLNKNFERNPFDKSGGGRYNLYLLNLLRNSHDCMLKGSGIGGLLKRDFFRSIYRALKIEGYRDVWIHDINSMVLPIKQLQGYNVLIFHHIGGELPTPNMFINKYLNKLFFKNLKNIDLIVVSSKFWKEFFHKMGYTKTKIIYNPFDLTLFNFDEKELHSFKDKHNFTKPIIYLGNCQRIKGVVESYENLKGLDVHLVTSGDEKVKIPAINLNLDYKNYLLLLKTSSVVVTMSKFEEGWCRTAHESMLCKTPVVGSGLGGMGELLQDGNQIICKDFNKLAEYVTYLNENPEIGELGYKYASKKRFTINNFSEEWKNIFESINYE